MKADESLLTMSIIKCRKAVEIKPDFHEAWNNWGIALSSLGRIKKDESLLTESIEKYRKALEIKPDHANAWNNWGNALSFLGEMKEDESLLTEGIGKYRKALEIKPDFRGVWSNWGNMLLRLSYLKDGEERERVLDDAMEKCMKAEEMKPGGGAYNIACIYSLKNKKELAFEWLGKGLQVDIFIPSRKDVEKDRDFENVRGDPRFKELLDKYRPIEDEKEEE